MSTDDTSAATTAGKDGCLCTDESTTLAAITKRSCTTADGDDNGVLLSAEGPCVNYMYGSLNCLRHDLNVDPACNTTSPEGGESTIPEYCQHRWCYVDAKSCGKDSLERVFRSTYFPAHMGVDLFYSYTTCNSLDAHWNPHKYVAELGSIKAAIPSYTLPFIYKRSPADDDILSEIGEEYYEDSVPFEGVHIEFVRSLQSVADGEFNVTYTHGTRANKLMHKTSAYTAAVQDIEDGLVDLAVGPFWITGERLKMSAFTMPIVYDRTILVIPKPGTQGSLSAQTKKVLAPFETGVWVLLLLIIAFTGLLSVWFSGKRFYQKKRSNRPDKSKYTRLALDEFLRKGIFFCSAGVEQDEGASLSHKLLMFGFGFFILIVVSAYVANLAAFLTRSMPKYIGTMEEVVDAGLQVCAHPALREEYKIAWPTANFVFNESGDEDFYGLIEDYDNGRCDVIAIGSVETLADMDLLNMFCTRDLVMTDSLVLENPIAYPIRADLGEQFSYWIYEAEKYHGISIQASQKEYDTEHHRQPKCTVELSKLGLDSINKYAQISVANLFFPCMFFLAFAVAASIVQCYFEWSLRKGKQRESALVGRISTLHLNPSEEPDSLPRRAIGVVKRKLSGGDDDKKYDDVKLPKRDINGSYIDNFKDNDIEHASTDINNDVGHTSSGGDSSSATLSKFQQLLSTGALDEFIFCLERMKKEKKRG